jgi:hypothetical protein
MALIARALLAPVAIGTAAFGLVSILPHPTRADRIAVRALNVLDREHGAGAVISLDGQRVIAACRRLPSRHSLVTLSDGVRLVLRGTDVGVLDAGPRFVASRAPLASAIVSAEADLAGSHTLYAKELIGRLVHRRPVLVGLTRFDGVAAYRLRLGRDRPRVELLVARRSLRPLAASYQSRWVSGTSRLRLGGPGTC